MHGRGEMTEPTTQPGTLTRRRLVQAGAAGTAVAGLGGIEQLEGIAAAATPIVPKELRRSTYLALTNDRFEIGGPGGQVLRMISVDDLADPALSGRDDAFSVRLRGNGQVLESGIHRLYHRDLGRSDLFISPVDTPGASQDYELIVDRTVAIPGLGGADQDDGRMPSPPVRLLGASLRRGRHHRLVVDANLDATAELVRGSLLRGSRVVARAIGHPDGTTVRLRFKPRAEAPAGRYALRLEIIDAAGNESAARRSLRLR